VQGSAVQCSAVQAAPGSCPEVAAESSWETPRLWTALLSMADMLLPATQHLEVCTVPLSSVGNSSLSRHRSMWPCQGGMQAWLAVAMDLCTARPWCALARVNHVSLPFWICEGTLCCCIQPACAAVRSNTVASNAMSIAYFTLNMMGTIQGVRCGSRPLPVLRIVRTSSLDPPASHSSCRPFTASDTYKTH
jgi:hypothetical protein